MSLERPPDPATLHAADAERAARAVTAGEIPLHAASVQIGETIVAFSGASGSGKSTLCAAAVLGGHRFVADEITAVAPDPPTVRPYHRPIGLRSGGSDALGVDFPDDRRNIPGAVNPWPVDDRHHSTGGPLSGIFLVRFEPGPTSITPVEPPQGLVELSQHIVVEDDELIAAVFRRLDALVRRVPVFRIVYGEPREGIAHVVEEVGRWSR